MHDTIVGITEGLLFLSGDEGLTLEQILACFDEEVLRSDLEEVLEAIRLSKEASNSGIQLVYFGGVYKFVSKEMVHPYAQRLFQSSIKMTLSPAALETLSIIAYKQPITRVEIEEIRGVNCDAMVRKLVARGFIQEAGRSEAIGKPFLYEVTNDFLDSFQLETLKDLPDLPSFDEDEQQTLFEE